MSNFFSQEFIAQGVGILASSLIIFAFTHKSDKRFKIFVMMGALTFAGHFYLLGAYAGMAVNLTNACRSGLSIRFHNSNIVLVTFILIYISIGIFVYETPADALPFIAGSMSTFAMYKLSGIKFRLYMSFVSCIWLAYGIIFQSIGGIMTELFIQGTNAITIFRLYRDKKKKVV